MCITNIQFRFNQLFKCYNIFPSKSSKLLLSINYAMTRDDNQVKKITLKQYPPAGTSARSFSVTFVSLQ